MLQIQKPDLETSEAGMTTPLKKAFHGFGTTTLSSMTFNKLVGKDCLAAIKALKVNYQLTIASGIAQFNIGSEQIKTFLPTDFNFQMKANLIKSGIEMHLGIGEQTPIEDFLLDGTDSLETKPEGVDMAHKEIEKEATGITTVPRLKDAVTFYEPVLSTGAGSRYVYVACEKNGAGKLAIRIKGDKVSIRVEPYTDNLSDDMDILGLNKNGDYASNHFDMGGSFAMKRYWAMLKASLETWDVAKFNEAKIRELGA
jgi:hypothetical protein